MLPKDHLTLNSRMLGSRWVITPSSVYSCHLFLISSAFVGPYHFCPLSCLPLQWNVPLPSPVFLKRSLVIPILLFSSISLHCSLKKAFLSLLTIFWNSVFSWLYLSLYLLPYASVFFSAICRACWDNHFAFLHFFSLRCFCLLPPSIILQELCH